MNDTRIRADSFMLKSRRTRIYRVRHNGSGTLLWLSAEKALRYLKEQQIKKIQAKDKGW